MAALLLENPLIMTGFGTWADPGNPGKSQEITGNHRSSQRSLALPSTSQQIPSKSPANPSKSPANPQQIPANPGNPGNPTSGFRSLRNSDAPDNGLPELRLGIRGARRDAFSEGRPMPATPEKRGRGKGGARRSEGEAREKQGEEKRRKARKSKEKHRKSKEKHRKGKAQKRKSTEKEEQGKAHRGGPCVRAARLPPRGARSGRPGPGGRGARGARGREASAGIRRELL